MASPQTENGYTRLANELYDKLFGLPLTGAEFKVMACVIRKTYGFHKKSDKIPLSQFQEYTNLSRKTVCNCINRLVSLKLLVVTKATLSITEYHVQKDYEKWVVSPRSLVTKVTKGSVMRVTKLVSGITHSKETKETIQKKVYTDLSEIPIELIQSLADKRKVSVYDVKLVIEQVLDHNAQKKRYTDILRATNSWLITRIQEGKIKQQLEFRRTA